MRVDLIIQNANIVTLDSSHSIGKSVAIADGKIVDISYERNLHEHEYNTHPGTQIIDLKGATLLPGFIDTHSHLLMYGEMMDYIDCRSPFVHNILNIAEKVYEKAKQSLPGQWILGWGYDDTLLEEKRHPTRFDLDLVSPNNPVFIRHISNHFAVANTKALELAGISRDIKDPQGGFFGRNAEGELDGVIYEFSALDRIYPFLPVPTKEESVEQIRRASQVYLSQGITTFTDACVGLDKGMEEIEAHIEAVNTGANPMTTRMMISSQLLKGNSPFAGYTASQLQEELQKRSNGKIHLDSAKLFQDGSIQGYTAALREPYKSRDTHLGELIHPQETLNKEVLDFHNRGFRIATHGNGDRAIHSIILAYQGALKQNPKENHQHRIEHVQTASDEDLKAMKVLGIVPSFFINHVYYWGDRHKNIFLGQKRASRMNPLAEAKELDLLFTLHSDCPITPISPLFSVWAAVNRVTKEGYVLGEEQKIDVETALKSMISYGAKLNFEEETKGTIEIGKEADFVVLGQDPLTCPPEEIKDIEILSTIIGGKVVWEKEMACISN
ncbi:amidohydrolase [Niallia oryzisoli]|uniref:Amidohydrolase n=1 Tax=Niallia oryzisoli TaxID=1737571 RepID=A0ABZ2CJC0_9BACI